MHGLHTLFVIGLHLHDMIERALELLSAESAAHTFNEHLHASTEVMN